MGRYSIRDTKRLRAGKCWKSSNILPVSKIRGSRNLSPCYLIGYDIFTVALCTAIVVFTVIQYPPGAKSLKLLTAEPKTPFDKYFTMISFLRRSFAGLDGTLEIVQALRHVVH